VSNNSSIYNKSIKNKLPYELEHLDALIRMKTLKPYYEWTKSIIDKYLGSRILDAGSGVGNFIDLVQEREFILAVDLSSENIKILEERFASSLNITVRQYDLDYDLEQIKKNRIDTIVCLDVLEHVENDVELLSNFRKVIEPNGRLIIKVPALEWLYGSIDESSGHFRRYSRHKLISTTKEAGWTPCFVTYMNIFGLVPYLIKGRLLKRTSNFSKTFSNKQLKILQLLMPTLQKIDKLLGPPVGQSLILVAK